MNNPTQDDITRQDTAHRRFPADKEMAEVLISRLHHQLELFATEAARESDKNWVGARAIVEFFNQVCHGYAEGLYFARKCDLFASNSVSLSELIETERQLLETKSRVEMILWGGVHSGYDLLNLGSSEERKAWFLLPKVPSDVDVPAETFSKRFVETANLVRAFCAPE